MKSLDIHRFWNLLKLDLYPKGLMVSLGVACGVSVPIVLVYYLMFWNHFQEGEDSMAFTVGIVISCILMSPFFIRLGWARKEDRIAFFMIPASNLEKYLDRIIFATFILVVGVISSVVVWNVVFYLLMIIKVGLAQATCPLMHFGNYPGNIFSTFTQMLLIHSFFTVGTLFFNKKAWLFTLVIFILLMYGLIQASNGMGLSLSQHALIFELDVDDFSTIGNIVGVFISFGFYYLSYQLFKRMQVVNNGLINI